MKFKIVVSVFITALLITGCSPVSKVKLSKVDLLGNELWVWRIIHDMSGYTGEVTWSEKPSAMHNDCDIVSADIKRHGVALMLSFSYNRTTGKCEVVEFRKNGEPQAPLYIYSYLKKSLLPQGM